MRCIIRLSRSVFHLPQLSGTKTLNLSPALGFSNKKYYCSERTIKIKQKNTENVNFDAASNSYDQDRRNDSSTSSSSESEDEQFEQQNAEEELHHRILDASLQFVRDYGWTTEAIARGAESLGYSRMSHGMFNGGVDLVNHFYNQSNIRLENELKDIVEKKKELKEKFATTDLIREAVELRLRMNAEHIESWSNALVLHGSPTNLSNAVKNLATLVDSIWYYAGDQSFDLNWYTKRGVLAAIYKSTEICMIQDSSEDFQDTWAFLDRRINNVKILSSCVKGSRDSARDISKLAQVGFITMRNLIGMNYK